jgi:hypothetical protein
VLRPLHSVDPVGDDPHDSTHTRESSTRGTNCVARAFQLCFISVRVE